jgi:1,4-dihydroxy-2-naphthoate octaprenyltransferase
LEISFIHRVDFLLRMMRAQFLIGIFFPILSGVFVAVFFTGVWNVVGLVFVLLTGLGLHIATNVYNDVYDTRQGADAVEDAGENFLSGGSGLILGDPGLQRKMVLLARSGLVLSLVGVLGLLTQVLAAYWWLVVFIYVLSVFLSKYYTAAPFKFGYRGLGEFFIWLSFGPLAVLLGMLSQGAGLDPRVIPFLPLTGLTTLTILWFGQLMDSKNDRIAGKLGLALRMGTHNAVYAYVVLHGLILVNFLMLGYFYPLFVWVSLVLVGVDFLVLPRVSRGLAVSHDRPLEVRRLSPYNMALYLVCSFLFLGGTGLLLVLGP